MAQRRNSSGREDNLSDVKALAAKARETGGPVVSKPNAAELSGVRPRRDSVIGMRLTPSPRATTSELPNWFWGVLGCLSVLLVGFAGLFLLGRSGKLAPLLGDALVATAPVAAPVAPPAPAAEPVAKEPAVAAPAEHPGAPEHAARLEHQHAHVAAPAEPSAVAEKAPAPEAVPAVPPADNSVPVAADDGARRAARAPKAKAGKEGEAPAGGDDDNAGGDTPEAKAAPARQARAAAAPKAAADDSDDDQPLPGQDDVERALDGLAPRVRGCFVKYQIKGTARVRLVATPAGKAEAVNVTGDFEDTPTGLCVESVLTDAKLPTFKGPPLKLSQSYQLH